MVKHKLNSSTKPINAATPIQYQCASVKNARDFITRTPTVSVECGGTYYFERKEFNRELYSAQNAKGNDNNINHL